MGIPILSELNEELTRLYIAGSGLAAGDPRLKKYIAPLEKLGERAPVFAKLAERLTALTEGSDKASPQNLMETGMLLQSVRYTQGSADTGEALAPAAYADTPLKVAKTPYSSLHAMIELLGSGSQQHSDLPMQLYHSGQYRDPRLYAAYIQAIGDNKTYISSCIEETILPALGGEIAPFLLESLDIAGGKRNARLFRVLRQIMGPEILPLAEKALAEGAPHVQVEAIYALGTDLKYEQTLLGYTKDKKGDVRQASFSALTSLGSAAGEEQLLAALQKANIGPLEEALSASNSPAVPAAVLEQARVLLDDPKKSAAKLKVLLRALAARDEEAGLGFLEKLLLDRKFYETNVNILDLSQLLPILLSGNTPRKNELLYRISDGVDYMLHYKAQVCVRMFDAAGVYDRLKGDVGRKGGHNFNALLAAYNLGWNQTIPDAQKTWDRRWAGHLLAKEAFTTAYQFVYDDDRKAWKHLMECMARNVDNRRFQSPYYAGIMAHAFKIAHPDAQKYYDKLVKKGYPREKLDEAIAQNASGYYSNGKK